MFFVYIIVSEINGLRFYVGMTANLDNRLKEHNSGKTTATYSSKSKNLNKKAEDLQFLLRFLEKAHKYKRH